MQDGIESDSEKSGAGIQVSSEDLDTGDCEG